MENKVRNIPIQTRSLSTVFVGFVSNIHLLAYNII